MATVEPLLFDGVGVRILGFDVGPTPYVFFAWSLGGRVEDGSSLRFVCG